MRTTCEYTLGRLLTETEVERLNCLMRDNGGNRVDGSLVAQIDQFSRRAGCPHLHRLDEETGYCSCEAFITEWTTELGETAGLHNGRVL